MTGESFEMVALNNEEVQVTQAKPTPKAVEKSIEAQPDPLPQTSPPLTQPTTIPPILESKPAIVPEPPFPKQTVQTQETTPLKQEFPEPEPVKQVAQTTVADKSLKEPEINKPSLDKKSTEFAAESKKLRTLPRSDAAYLNNKTPNYPVSARRRRLEGLVLLEVTVEPDGYPSLVDIKQSSGHRILDNAARGAVEDWRFVPAEENGQLITAKVDVPIRFTLR